MAIAECISVPEAAYDCRQSRRLRAIDAPSKIPTALRASFIDTLKAVGILAEPLKMDTILDTKRFRTNSEK
jgi:hypothetical protein